VAVTGDIAYSGLPEQYRVAASFFQRLSGSLKAISPPMEVWFAFIPGNHDCDHSAKSDLRQIAIDGMSTRIDEIDPAGATVRELLSAHQNFFEFQSSFTATGQPVEPWLTKSLAFTHNGRARIKVLCLNTALMSQKEEKQGKLYFPVQALDRENGTEADLVITLMHHPYTWIESDNGIKLQARIERISDMVLTGHVHVESAYTKTNLGGEQAQYVAGGVLQNGSSSVSAFNLVLCDLEKRQQQIFQFAWDEGIYRPQNEPSWSPFVRNGVAHDEFEISQSFRAILHDAGLGIAHPRKKELHLEDLFVYPDLAKVSLAKSRAPEEIKGDSLVDYIARTDRALILGGAQAGKTSLAKMLYLDLMKRHNLVPLFLTAPEIKATTEEALAQTVWRAFRQQYSESKLEDFKQCDRSKIVLVIDDWHRAKAIPRWQAWALSTLPALVGKIILFASDEFRIEEIASHHENVSPLLSFDRCEIKQFGHVLRGRLIEKWHGLDADGPDSSVVEQDEGLIASMVRKNVLPCYPATVLLVLQTREASKAANVVNGSYGYLYEALITKALARVGGDAAEIDTRYTLISRIAYYLFKHRQKSLTEAEISDICEEYSDTYEIPISVQNLISDLDDAGILASSDGNLRFRYRYIYYYFVARYFQENLRSAHEHSVLGSELNALADRAANEDYANILMFVIYLTKDPDLIEHILQNAARVFAEFKPCNFADDVKFLNELTTKPTVILPASSVEENRQERRRMLDQIDAVDQETPEEEGEAISYHEETNIVVKLNFALRTLDLMGQVLRNFPGSLRKEIKLDIARSAYLLGLRVLRSFLNLMENDIERFRSSMAEAVKLNKPKEKPESIARATNDALFFLARIAGYGLVKRVSYAVGAKILERTYKGVLDAEGGTVPVSLIDLSVRLDHLSFPENEIRRLWKRTEDNLYAGTLVRDLVASHLYLHELENRKRQTIEALLDIRKKKLSLTTGESKAGKQKNKK
jgi:hypothetical protein